MRRYPLVIVLAFVVALVACSRQDVLPDATVESVMPGALTTASSQLELVGVNFTQYANGPGTRVEACGVSAPGKVVDAEVTTVPVPPGDSLTLESGEVLSVTLPLEGREAGESDVRVVAPNGSTTVVEDAVTCLAVPDATIEAEPTEGDLPLTVAFDAGGTRPSEGVSFAWDFGDGITESGATVEHTFTEAGAFEVTLTATDAAGASGTATTTITVRNDAPSFTTEPPAAALVGSTFTYDVMVEDPNGTTPTFALDTDATWLSLTDRGDGTARLEGTPTESDLGEVAVTITADDGTDVATQSFTLAVQRGSTIITTSPPEPRILTGDTYTYDVHTEGAGGEIPTLTAEGLPEWMTFTDHGDGTATLAGIPVVGDVGTHDVMIHASTSVDAKPTPHAFGILVHSATTAFTITPDDDALLPGEPASYQLEAVGAEGSAPSIDAPWLPSWMSYSQDSMDPITGTVTGTLSGAPTEGDVGIATLTLEASTPDDTTPDTHEFKITVYSPTTNISHAPGDETLLVGENGDYHVDAIGAEGVTPTITVTGLPDGMSYVEEGHADPRLGTISGAIRGTPTLDALGTHAVTIEAATPTSSDTSSFDLTVQRAETVFTTNLPDQEMILDGTELNVTVEAAGAAGETPTLSASNLPTWLAFTDHGDGTGQLAGMPPYEAIGDARTITLTASTSIDQIQHDLRVTVERFQAAFTSTPPTEVRALGSYTYAITAEGRAGDIPSITAPDIPAWLTLTDHGDGTATLEGSPPAELEDTTHSVILRAEDGHSPAEQSFDIAVTKPTPIITKFEAERSSSRAFYFSIFVDDLDEDPVTCTLHFGNGTTATLDRCGEGGIVQYMHYDAPGTYHVTLVATDEDGTTAKTIDVAAY